jgi:endoglycosylceramidase
MKKIILIVLLIGIIFISGCIKQPKKPSGDGSRGVPVTTTLATTTTIGIATTISMTTTTLATTTTSSNGGGGGGSITTTNPATTSMTSTTSTTTIPMGASYLHTDGKYIKDSQGNVVILHGLNHENYAFNNFANQFANGRYLEITEADYKKMAEWGFNVVRLGIAWQNIEPTEGSYDESYFANYIDKNIAWAKKYEIHVVLSFMQWGWSPYFDSLKSGAHGFPSWLFTGYEVSDAGITQSRADFLLGLGPSGTVATTSNPSMQDRMINVWKYVATRYKNEPTVLGYDLFNEPPDGGLGTNVAMDSYLLPFYERLVDEIKTVDSNHIFIYEPIGGRWDNAPRVLNRSNVIFSTHIYTQDNDKTVVTNCWQLIPPRCGYRNNITVLRDQINGYLDLPAANPSRNWNIPIYLGEFGIKPEQIGYFYKYEWLNDLIDVLNENKIIYWSDYGYCRLGPNPTSGCEWSMVNPDGTEITSYMNVLDKPYPRVSSVPPLAYSFNQTTKHFKVVFDGIGNVETEIYVPSRYYPVFTVNSNSSSWSNNWDETSRVLTVSATLNDPIEITIDSA